MNNPEKHLLAKIGQYAIITNPENKVLLLKRKRSGYWSLPGGRLDNDDRDWKIALIREVREETGLEIISPKPFGITLIEDDYQVKYCVFFTVPGENMNNIKLSPEHSDYIWVDKEQTTKLTLDDEPKVREVLSNYFV